MMPKIASAGRKVLRLLGRSINGERAGRRKSAVFALTGDSPLPHSDGTHVSAPLSLGGVRWDLTSHESRIVFKQRHVYHFV